MTSKVNGKTGTLTPCISENPENFITKIGQIDYVAVRGNTHAKFYGNGPRGVRPINSQNITSCDFVYLPFPFFPFPSLSFLADSTNGRAIGTELRLSVCLSVTFCIVAKRCVLQQKLLLRAYRKLYVRYRLVPK